MLPSPRLGACRHESIRRRSAKERRKKREPQVQRVPDRRWAILPRDVVHVYNNGTKIGEGSVIKCYRPHNHVWVSGVNVKSKQKVDRSDPQHVVTRTITEEAPVHYSMVNLVDPVDGKRTRIKRAFLEDGRRVRIATRSGAVIERVLHTPKTPYAERIARPIAPFTTAKEDVVLRTYVPP
jgi:large subunit ribosomal protein L24